MNEADEVKKVVDEIYDVRKTLDVLTNVHRRIITNPNYASTILIQDRLSVEKEIDRLWNKIDSLTREINIMCLESIHD